MGIVNVVTNNWAMSWTAEDPCSIPSWGKRLIPSPKCPDIVG